MVEVVEEDALVVAIMVVAMMAEVVVQTAGVLVENTRSTASWLCSRVARSSLTQLHSKPF